MDKVWLCVHITLYVHSMLKKVWFIDKTVNYSLNSENCIVSEISSDLQFKNGFTTVPFKPWINHRMTENSMFTEYISEMLRKRS